MTNAMQDQWLGSAVGKYYNPDGVYAYQCVDVAIAYADHIFIGLGWQTTFGRGNAKDHYPKNNGYWDNIPNIVGDLNSIPRRGDVVIWSGDSYNPYGHIAVVVEANAYSMTVLQQNANGKANLPTQRAVLSYNQAGTGPVVGWLRPRLAAAAPAPAALAGNQRLVGGSGANQRSTASASASIIRSIAGGTTETFTHFVRGESVTVNGFTSNIWFGDADGYVWAGAFESQSTDGLADRTPSAPAPAPVASNERVVGPSGAFQRKIASASSPAIRTITGGTTENFTHFVRGESVTVGGFTSNVWFGDDAGYVWSGAFESQSTDGLVDRTPAPPTPAPAPVVTTSNERTIGENGGTYRAYSSRNAASLGTLNPNDKITLRGYETGEAPYNDGNDRWFVDVQDRRVWTGCATDPSVAGLLNLTSSTPVVSDKYDFVVDFDFAEKFPANITNIQRGDGFKNFPVKPSTAVCHWWGSPANNISIHSVIGEFQRANALKSAHFVVSGTRIIQMVSLSDRAYHASTSGNVFIGIEIDPRFDAETQASVRKLLAALRDKFGYKLNLTLHKNVPGNNTLCSGLDLSKLEISVAPSVPPVVVVPVINPPAPVPTLPVIVPPVVNLDTAVEIRKFSEWLLAKYISETKGQ